MQFPFVIIDGHMNTFHNYVSRVGLREGPIGYIEQRRDGCMSGVERQLHLGALCQARCWRIRVGGCAETADLIERLIADKGRT